MSTYIPSFKDERLKEPLQRLSFSESPFTAGNITMYTSQQPNISNDNENIGIHDSNVVSQQELWESRIRGNDGGILRDCRSYEMLLMDQMGSHNTTSGTRFHSDQYLDPNIGLVEKSTQDSKCYPYEISYSNYLKAVQQLLDEVVNAKKVRKQQCSKNESMNDSQEVFGKSKNKQDSSVLSAAEKQDLQNKMTKLSSMLTEVDRRYKQYYHQMEIIISSFDLIAGRGAAKPYTSLALQTISTHFRCLKDAINSQIKEISRSLGEKDSDANEIVISRLRFVDQQLRQQKHAQQFGTTHEHIWRPQRGLPESCVSTLRAWLFEHFLHPYPKDSEKTMLARQTGLTKSQVSNWFINARVRLWKPMVEEMYQEESVDAAMDSNSSSDFTPKKTLLNQAQDMNQSAASSNQAHDTKISSCIVNDPDVLKNPIINGVSLTLRLQHIVNSSPPNLPSIRSPHHSLLDSRDKNCNTPNL